MSGLYSGLFKILPEEHKPEINNRLGEAMKMADLMTSAYSDLIQRLLPDSLDHYNEMEKSGYFDKSEIFHQPLISLLPILWKSRSIPALEHFIRNTDYESADMIIEQANRHQQLLKPVWQIIQSDTALVKNFSHVATAATEGNSMLDFLLARLNYYAASGLYDKGTEAVTEATLAFSCSYQFQPERLWITSARFFETLGNFTKADSLYKLCDDHFKKEQVENPNPLWTLSGENQTVLHARLGASIPQDQALTDAWKNFEKKICSPTSMCSMIRL